VDVGAATDCKCSVDVVCGGGVDGGGVDAADDIDEPDERKAFGDGAGIGLVEDVGVDKSCGEY